MDSSTMTAFADDPTMLGSASMPALPILPPSTSQELVMVYVRKEPFRIRKSHLTHYSLFFAAAFNGAFAESQTQSMKLRDIKPRLFSILVNWLYTQELFDQDGHLPSCRVLVELWIMADRFMMPILQNHAMEALNTVRLEGKVFSSRLVHKVYACTNDGSLLRTYLVDMYVKGMDGGLRDDDPPEFLVDVIREMRALIKPSRKRGRNGEEGKWEPNAKRMKTYHVNEDIGGCRRGSQEP